MTRSYYPFIDGVREYGCQNNNEGQNQVEFYSHKLLAESFNNGKRYQARSESYLLGRPFAKLTDN